MRASAWKALRSVCSHSYPQRCRFIAGRRFSPSHHHHHNNHPFHTSLSRPHENEPTDAAWNPVIDGQHATKKEPEEIITPQTGVQDDPDDGPEKPPRPKDKSNYGSASRRAGRNIKKVKELPPLNLPSWLLERNIVLRGTTGIEDMQRDTEQAQQDEKLLGSQNTAEKDEHTRVKQATQAELATSSNHATTEKDASENDEAEKSPLDASGEQDSQAASTVESPAIADGEGYGTAFVADSSTMEEILSVVSAGLQTPSIQRAEFIASSKPHVVLCCPRDGGSSFLDALGYMLAVKNSTDFLRLNPQDIAEIGGDYLDEPGSFRRNTLSSLGYDAPLMNSSRSAPQTEDPADDEENEESEEEDSDDNRTRPSIFPQNMATSGIGAIRIGAFAGSFKDLFKPLSQSGGFPQANKPFGPKPVLHVKDSTPELKMSFLVDRLLDSPEIKRQAEKAGGNALGNPEVSKEEPPGDASEDAPLAIISSDAVKDGSERLIVLIQDYPQINSTFNGGKFLHKLHESVEARRKEGQRILIIGTDSNENLVPSLSRSSLNDVQAEPRNGPTRTIVTPIKELPRGQSLAQKHKLKMKEINTRHLRDMIRRMAPVPAQVASLVWNWDLEIDSKSEFLSGLDEYVWTMDRVNRVATTAFGLLKETEEMTNKHLEGALELIESSDNDKAEWMTQEKEKETNQRKIFMSTTEATSKEWMRKLRKSCNEHERKLLNGVVDPGSIKTTFADVQAPSQTIDALKTLTSLSLVRPDAFAYGVLATDRIPGLLLYGPPGTGKTLLARAVAKESGATVLEVSGSDVYDMYVGEGEKNVRAIFTLAKKLSPCIVFIDEADAILGARSSGGNRTSHRELINQFLREWDGMTDLSAFIMVATNRPFDLDEASLRRLPRRLLVDLPTENDREAILKIHLKDELIDREVSLSELASQTPFYSGSDLKNLAVAAALACVREEFDTAASSTKDSATGEKYEYPEKRTLYRRHFTKGMEEISASVSEDMGSLSAIRKFDEKYGDRRGRRKKLGGYGFKTTAESEKQGSDAARVRNQT